MYMLVCIQLNNVVTLLGCGGSQSCSMLGGDSVEVETESVACSSLTAREFISFSFVDTCKYNLIAPWWHRSPMISRKADSYKAQELRNLEWSEIKLCMFGQYVMSKTEYCFQFCVKSNIVESVIIKLSLAKRWVSCVILDQNLLKLSSVQVNHFLLCDLHY